MTNIMLGRGPVVGLSAAGGGTPAPAAGFVQMLGHAYTTAATTTLVIPIAANTSPGNTVIVVGYSYDKTPSTNVRLTYAKDSLHTFTPKGHYEIINEGPIGSSNTMWAASMVQPKPALKSGDTITCKMTLTISAHAYWVAGLVAEYAGLGPLTNQRAAVYNQGSTTLKCPRYATLSICILVGGAGPGRSPTGAWTVRSRYTFVPPSLTYTNQLVWADRELVTTTTQLAPVIWTATGFTLSAAWWTT
jgi:hypothetical protein